MKKTVFIFGALIIGVLTLFQISTYSITSGNLTTEIVIGSIAIIFFFFGIYWNRKNKSNHETNTISEAIKTEHIAKLGITDREYEILIKISEGHSNREIGNQLFISESTVKTHVSNLFLKLDAKRRTQAIQKAKAMQIIA
ncbi:response regulator transcription factor [Rasiella rasia]|uniref:Response regulator transcription factor n=1 Tax=Rasiella rasia TaxID=2744027 RepID=A0A6G6GMJ3_9FLAO|nr:response regulator transcription factor [Rasiella rasia]QIE59744.1 response regulator transcription factor [Rasiella rasia]